MSLQTLRQAKFLARLVLVWFVLSLGLAIASPMVNPNGSQLICSGTSVKLINADGGEASSGHTLDCPLCSPGAASVLELNQSFAFSSPLSQALSRDMAAYIAATTVAPFSARAPPFSL
ncbi:MAG: hypothetical protein RLZZ271_1146 [Pseudomonadota bacterium]|jgi:hypothetical protein